MKRHVADTARAAVLLVDFGTPGPGAPPFVLPFGQDLPDFGRRRIDIAGHRKFVIAHRSGLLSFSPGRARRAGRTDGRAGHPRRTAPRVAVATGARATGAAGETARPWKGPTRPRKARAPPPPATN